MHIANEFGIAQCLAAELGRQGQCEVLEGTQRRADVDFVIFVEEYGEEGLCAAGILDGLRGKEEVLGGGVVVFAVFGSAGGVGGLADGVFEEKDYAVEGREGLQGCGIEGDEFLKLDIFDA